MISIVALFDLDGTLCSGHIWDGFLRYYLGRKRRRAWLLGFWATHLPLWLLSKWGLIGEEKCRAKWMEDSTGIFEGGTEGEVLEVFRWVTDNYIFKSLRSDVVEVLEQHKQSGHVVVIVSGTGSQLLEIVGQRLGVADVIGTKLEVIDGRYTGKIIKPLCSGENKARLLKEFIDRSGLEVDLSSSFAYADTISDIPLLKLVGNPVATYPDGNLRQFAERNGWQILP